MDHLPPLEARAARATEREARLHELVRGELVRELYGHSSSILWTTAVNASIVAAVVDGFHGFGMVAGWWLVLMLWSLGRVELARRFRRAAPELTDLPSWGVRFMWGSAGAGVLWGIAGGLFYVPGALPTELLLTFVLGGMAAGASTTLPHFLPAYYAYVVPSLPPLIFRLASGGDPTHWAMGFMLGVFGVALLVIGRRTHRDLVTTHRLRFENEFLLSDLTEADRRLQRVNEELEARVRERTRSLEEETRQRVETEKRLERARRMEMVGQLTGGLAHDFNNLLTVIAGNLELMLATDVGSEVRTRIEAASHASDRGAHLVRSLLAFGRRESLFPQATDVSRFVGELLQSFVSGTIPENISVRESVAGDVWPVFVDPARLEAALVNLLINSKDAMDTGGTITVHAENVSVGGDVEGDDRGLEPGDYVRISVSDTGRGMSPAVRDRVFEPFFTTKTGDSSGLGLSMVSGFASQSGGAARVTSTEGEGTTVDLYLKRSSGSAPPAAEEQAPDSRLSGAGRTVLVVEDEPQVRDVAVSFFERLGFTVVEAESGDAAWSRMDGLTPDLLFSDVVMPGARGGVELATLARERFPGLPILLASGYEDAERVQGWSLIRKPYDLTRLERAVAEVMEDR
ncbi:MAG: ATP-binding protein [Gemmatimonadota bacterium]|nr:ATP-binding protein [Gemmatimonadota bacterium]MDH5758485.1 ATP-binding protein [Gemmatimonadota bacterium]